MQILLFPTLEQLRVLQNVAKEVKTGTYFEWREIIEKVITGMEDRVELQAYLVDVFEWYPRVLEMNQNRLLVDGGSGE